MTEFKVKNDSGLELTIITSHPKGYCCLIGGDDLNPTWEEYIDSFKPQYRPHIELIKKAIEELGWVGETAERYAGKYCFAFSDGTAYGFTCRGWGDIMQAIVGKREGYMAYYM